MENQKPITASEPQQVATMNLFQRLFGMFFEPQKTFEDVDRKGAWLGIFLIMAALVSGALIATITRVDPETYMRKGLEQNPMTKKMSEEQKQQALQRSTSPIQRYMGPIFAPVSLLVMYLALAGIFLALFVIMGVSLTFKKSLAVTIWAMAPPAIVVTLLSILFIYLKDPDTLDFFNVTNNVVSNPGVLAPEKEQPILHSLLASIDLFSAWTIFLLAVGFATVSKRKLTTGKAAMGILLLWGIYVLGKAGIVAMFS